MAYLCRLAYGAETAKSYSKNPGGRQNVVLKLDCLSLLKESGPWLPGLSAGCEALI